DAAHLLQEGRNVGEERKETDRRQDAEAQRDPHLGRPQQARRALAPVRGVQLDAGRRRHPPQQRQGGERAQERHNGEGGSPAGLCFTACASSGPPRATPSANPDTSKPASGIDTSSPVATSGSNPRITNSAVPIQKQV